MQGDTTDVSSCWKISNQNEKWNILALGSRFHLRAWDWVDIIWSGCNENLACRLDVHLEYIGNTDCLHHLRKVWPLLMCCAWLFLRLVQTYKRQIDQYSKLSIFCSSVSDLVFLRATPLSHLGPRQLWKILCRRFRTRSNDSRIECSIGSADECGCSQKPCVFIGLFFRRQVPRVPDRICFEWQVFRFEWFW